MIRPTNEYLIKSGGGNGPVKPGNLRRLKVPNPAVRRKMRLETRLKEHPGFGALFLLC